MFTLKSAPFVWITSSFIVGLIPVVVLSHEQNLFTYYILIVLFLSGLASLKSNGIVHILCYACLFLISGLTYSSLLETRYNSSLNPKYLNQKISFYGKILSIKEGNTFYRTEFRLLQIRNADPIDRSLKKILVYLKKDSIRKMEPGDMIRINTSLQNISKPENPYAFDFKNYMKNKHILYQAFVQPEDYVKISKERQNTFKSNLYVLNSKLKSMISSKLTKPENASLINAITLGDKKTLTTEMLSAFSNVGIRHILTVSGMHVGMVLIILSTFFNLFKIEIAIIKTIKRGIILSTIWAYAFLVGAEPAVLRAAFMFTTIYVGKSLNNSTNSINTLFFSALVMLLLDPFLLNNLSFVFSYSAMLSILIFYPAIAKSIRFKNWILNYVWKIIALSISAQIIMMPLIIFHFHNLPLFFLIGAIIATPLAFILMFISILFFLDQFTTSFFEEFLSFILDKVADIFIVIVKSLGQNSVGSIQLQYLSGSELAIIYLLVLLLYLTFRKKNKAFLYLSLISFSCLTIVNFKNLKNTIAQNEMIIYSDKRILSIDFLNGMRCYNWHSESPEKVINQKNTFISEGYRNKKRVKRIMPLSSQNYYCDDAIESFSNYIIHNKHKIFILTDTTSFLPNCKTLDVLIIDRLSPTIDLCQFSSDYHLKNVVLTKRLPFYQRDEILDLLSDIDTVWCIRNKGAYMKSWKI